MLHYLKMLPFCFVAWASTSFASNMPATLVFGVSDSDAWRKIIQHFPQSPHCVVLSLDSTTAALAKNGLIEQLRTLAQSAFSPMAKVEMIGTAGACSLSSSTVRYIIAADRAALFEVTGRDEKGIPTSLSPLAEGPAELVDAKVPEPLRTEYFLDRILRGLKDLTSIPPCEAECKGYHTYYAGAHESFKSVRKNLIALSGDRAEVFPSAEPEVNTRLVTKLLIAAEASGQVSTPAGPSCTEPVVVTYDLAQVGQYSWSLTCGKTTIPLGGFAGVQRDLIPKPCLRLTGGYDVSSAQGIAIAPNVLIIFDEKLMQQQVPIRWLTRSGTGATCKGYSGNYVFHSPLSLSQMTLKPIDDVNAPTIERDRLQNWISASIDVVFDRHGKASRQTYTLYLASNLYTFSLSYPGHGFFTIQDKVIDAANKAVALEVARQKEDDDLTDMIDPSTLTVSVPFRLGGQTLVALAQPPRFMTSVARAERLRNVDAGTSIAARAVADMESTSAKKAAKEVHRTAKKAK